ncbi:MAG: hypothetical protein A2161_16160 [Candidatus Schekmanbacteria bacterium RBG_13_48_7]|uniref:Antitoxin FitA-like ribbon-helix-helix domain-containing protein n=1 Tax=Candidatus Schekmanbacteria bacterium RBG_13_48_7 TaxID=1817878 RepID=A0A1F7RSZ9_9BACT|nr:MAG: hypothetical protein A2161_16160 [Candidatus Schekmanbacteria bacterium RBG_13_48_7]
MPVNLSIKNVPDHIAERLRNRATKNHRSLQGELMAILEEIVTAEQPLTAQEFLASIRLSGLETPDEATKIIRNDRDVRSRT